MKERLVTETLLPKFIRNLFTYAEGYEVRVSLYLLNENYSLKAKLMVTKFIYRVIYRVIYSKFLIERNLSPAFLTTQTDQSGPGDRPWKAKKKGFKTSWRKTFAVGKKDRALYDDHPLVSSVSLQISMYKLNKKIFVLLISQQGKTVYYICIVTVPSSLVPA